jgi:uncharacterized damage-inducible protein DinB
MDINECLTHFIRNLNGELESALEGLSDEQLYHLPGQGCCHIAFHAWHIVRTEDNIINFACQNRKMPVWIRQGLPEKWSLPKVAQGTGMDPAEANALRVPSAGALIQYCRDVWADVEPYLSRSSAEELQSIARVPPTGERSKLQHVVQTVLTHGNRHLGQIIVLRSLQGLPGESF